MKVRPSFNGKPFEDSLKDLIKSVPVDTKKIIRNEAMFIVEGLVMETAPKSKNEEKMRNRIFKAFYRGYRKGQPPNKARRSFVVRGKPITATEKGLRGLVSKTYAHRGWFASGWVGKGNPLKAKVKAQVAKYQGGEGIIKVQENTFGIKIVGINASRFVAHAPKWEAAAKRIMDAVLRYRSSAIQKNLVRYKRGAQYRFRKTK